MEYNLLKKLMYHHVEFIVGYREDLYTGTSVGMHNITLTYLIEHYGLQHSLVKTVTLLGVINCMDIFN